MTEHGGEGRTERPHPEGEDAEHKNENKAAPDNGKPKKERKPLTEAQRLKRQKMIVLPAMVLVFIGAMWLIFAPSSDKEQQPGTGAPLNYEGFPKSVCTSINDVVCHGIPSKTEILQSGDIINVDVSTIYKGYFSDASRMFMIGDVSPEMRKLVQVTKECMEIGIAAAQPWKQLGDVGAAIQEHAEKNGFNVVRDLCGHGVGMQFHEAPDVEHFGRRGTGMMIVPGMTFTIEPMINMGTYEVFVDEADGWTVCTDDGLPSAQWENMILITETGNEILTY